MLAISLIAVGVTALALKFIMLFAVRLHLVDWPSADRKHHSCPRPVAGVALGMGTLSAWWILLGSDFTLTMGLGALGMMLLGVDDDRHPRPAWWRLVGQVVLAVAFVFASGTTFQVISTFGFSLPLGWLAVPFTALWIVTLTNAFNLIDGSDGLSIGIALLIAAYFSTGFLHLVAFALLISSVLFWWCNKPPAKLFLGDGGAYFLGFVLAAFSLYAVPDVNVFHPFGMGMLFLVPLGDMVYAILRRLRQKRSVFSSDDQHIHHRLERAWGSWPMLGFLYGMTLVGIGAHWTLTHWWR